MTKADEGKKNAVSSTLARHPTVRGLTQVCSQKSTGENECACTKIYVRSVPNQTARFTLPRSK